jgi:DNA-directed RNA polymerase specialized sigma24 family protein
MSYAEIGEALGISVSHVGVLLHRGKQQLQLRLGRILTD